MINGICLALSAEFGDSYKIYTESVKQGMEEPCFFVLCINPGHKAQITGRYLQSNQFSIQYFPVSSEEPDAECHVVFDRLCMCLELIHAVGAKVRGKEMSGHVEDGVLTFTVEYDAFICLQQEQVEMEQVSVDTNAKE